MSDSCGKKKFRSEDWRRNSKTLKNCLEKEMQWLEIAIEGFRKKARVHIEGHLRVNQDRKHVSYFLIEKKNDKHGKYLRKKDRKVAEAIAQEEYDKVSLRDLEKEYKLVNSLYQKLSYFLNQRILKKMHPGRRALLKVLCQEDERYEEAWAKTEVKTLVYMEEEKSFTTSGGVKVRSKSEKIIGELLEHEGIKYRYEMLMNMNGRVYAPDFVILNPNTHQEVIWEHFGKIGDIDYRVKTYEKIEAYTSAGFMEGRFFMTFEGEGEHKFNQALAEEIVAKLRRTD